MKLGTACRGLSAKSVLMDALFLQEGRFLGAHRRDLGAHGRDLGAHGRDHGAHGRDLGCHPENLKKKTRMRQPHKVASLDALFAPM